MKISIKKAFLLIMLLAVSMSLLTACGKDDSTDENTTASAVGTADNPFKLGVSPMSGWYAWYGVDGTGIFEKNGVYVDIEFFPVYSDSLTAFNSGQLDGICIAASDAIAPYNEGIDFKIVLVNDNSAGADALVVHDDSINSVKDLAGKSVATELGTLEHMYLLKLLDDNGMTIDDVNFVNMTINDAGPAFIAGSVDAAVLWEPTLSMAVEGGGKVLCSTETEPGLIPDTLAVRSEVLASSSDAVQNIVNSWFDGVEKLNARDEDFMEAIYNGAELSKDEYETMLNGVTIFDAAMNEATFQTGDDYTSLPFTINKSAEFLNSVGMVDGIPDALDSILDDTYIKNAQK
jgi:NitT/TauT family transport system substrate-binding protein